MRLNEKVILVDADGVLLDWRHTFQSWMRLNGYVLRDPDCYEIEIAYGIERREAKMLTRFFNESARVGWLPPHRDAVKYVRKLHEEHGYVFHCITSLSTDPFAGRLREDNLRRLFGPTVFEKVQCLETGADKAEALEHYRGTGCIWVEDKYENAIAGLNVGLVPILITHDHNRHENTENIHRVDTWKEIYEIIT